MTDDTRSGSRAKPVIPDEHAEAYAYASLVIEESNANRYDAPKTTMLARAVVRLLLERAQGSEIAQPVSEVWSVANRTSFCLFASEAGADAYLSSFTASVNGGMAKVRMPVVGAPVSMATPSEQQQRRERMLDEFAALTDNWDSYGAERFPPETIRLAREVSGTLGPEWNMVPCADGPCVGFYRCDEDEQIEVRTCYTRQPERLEGQK